MTDINKRMRALKGAVIKLLVEDDAFALMERKNPFMTNARQYQFLTNPEKVTEFKAWLQEQIDLGILSVDKRPFTDTYIQSAYKQGVTNAYIKTHKKELVQSSDFVDFGKDAFLQQTMAAPIARDTLEMIYTRAFDGLTGVTQQMATDMSRILSDGLASGSNANVIARSLNKRIDKLTRTRAFAIARTEVVYAYNEGQLDALSQLGIKGVTAEVEWLTAGDGLVCPECAALEGVVFSIQEARGRIPLHPNCRCAWAPAV